MAVGREAPARRKTYRVLAMSKGSPWEQVTSEAVAERVRGHLMKGLIDHCLS